MVGDILGDGGREGAKVLQWLREETLRVDRAFGGAASSKLGGHGFRDWWRIGRESGREGLMEEGRDGGREESEEREYLDASECSRRL